MSAKEMKARDEQKDTIALLVGSTAVGAFLVGSLVWWPGGAITLFLGLFAVTQSMRVRQTNQR